MAQSAEKESTSINRMLYWCNRGTVSFFQGKYEESNTYFNDADLYVEDYRKSFGNEALALVSNPMVKPYKPEDVEAVMVHYYKALNFIYLVITSYSIHYTKLYDIFRRFTTWKQKTEEA